LLLLRYFVINFIDFGEELVSITRLYQYFAYGIRYITFFFYKATAQSDTHGAVTKVRPDTIVYQAASNPHRTGGDSRARPLAHNCSKVTLRGAAELVTDGATGRRSAVPNFYPYRTWWMQVVLTTLKGGSTVSANAQSLHGAA